MPFVFCWQDSQSAWPLLLTWTTAETTEPHQDCSLGRPATSVACYIGSPATSVPRYICSQLNRFLAISALCYIGCLLHLFPATSVLRYIGSSLRLFLATSVPLYIVPRYIGSLLHRFQGPRQAGPDSAALMQRSRLPACPRPLQARSKNPQRRHRHPHAWARLACSPASEVSRDIGTKRGRVEEKKRWFLRPPLSPPPPSTPSSLPNEAGLALYMYVSREHVTMTAGDPLTPTFSTEIASSTASSIYVKWAVIEDPPQQDMVPHSIIQGFRVHYQKVASTYVQYSHFLPPSVGSYSINNLVADTYYKVMVGVECGGGMGRTGRGGGGGGGS